MRELSGTASVQATAGTGTKTLEVLGVQGAFTSAVYNEQEAINAVWILSSAGFIFLMQAGFALVEAGAVSRKNRNAMLIKNVYNVAIAAVAFWLFGYGLGFGDPAYFVG